MNKLKVFLFAFITLNMASTVKAEECILNGDTAIEINRYNLCLANQMSSSRNMQMENNHLRDEIMKLTEIFVYRHEL